MSGLTGKRCIGLVRCATGHFNALAKQATALRKFALANQMTWVDHTTVIGAVGCENQIVRRLAGRKIAANEFDVILVQRWDRLTRRGWFAAAAMLFDLNRVGIKVIAIEQEPVGSNSVFGHLFSGMDGKNEKQAEAAHPNHPPTNDS